MKNKEFYLDYITYLGWQLHNSKITKGKYWLLKISGSAFEDFKTKIQNQHDFSEKIIEIMKSQNRETKINLLFDDPD